MINKILLGGIFTILLSSVVFAQCEGYVDLALKQLSPPYPNYFAAAQEYWHAADCYELQGSVDAANHYYQISAEHYVQAASYLVDTGDQGVRALSYELAGDGYQKVGNEDLAAEYYLIAERAYLDLGEQEKANIVTYKLSRLEDSTIEETTTSPMTGLYLNIAGGMSLLSLLISASLLFYFLKDIFRKPKPSPMRYELKRDFSYKPKEPRREIPKREQPSRPALRTDPKEKLARKLREKYMPK